MHKVIILGCPGAGKSTFARQLHEKTHLPLYYLDMIWHQPDRTNVSTEEFDLALSQILEKDRWIIDGNYNRTIPMRLQACDTVFLLDIPVEICLDGALSRIGRKRVDMPWQEDEMDEEFRQWLLDFPQKQLPEIYRLLEQYATDKTVIIFKSREEIDQFIQNMPSCPNSLC